MPTPCEFWEEYVNADEHKRYEMARRLVQQVLKGCIKAYEKDRELGIHCMANMLQSWFNDIIECLD